MVEALENDELVHKVPSSSAATRASAFVHARHKPFPRKQPPFELAPAPMTGEGLSEFAGALAPAPATGKGVPH